MNQYIGTKLINAIPMTRYEYNCKRGWELPSDENGSDLGYLVEYLDGGKANHPDFTGYISWSPSDVFERAYRKTSGMSFGMAIEALKLGKKVARAGWNGKGMWLVLVPGRQDVLLLEGSTYANALPMHKHIEILPHIDMWTVNADGRRAMLPGWLASQTDILSDDWMILEGSASGS